jgi:hypothetical protein
MGPDGAENLAGFGGLDPSFQFANIIFQKFLDEIYPPQFMVHAGENLERGPVAFFGIAAQSGDGLAEVLFVIGPADLTENRTVFGGGTAGSLVILLERIGVVSQVDGRGLYALGFQALEQVKHVSVVALIFIHRCMFGAVVKFYVAKSRHVFASSLF